MIGRIFLGRYEAVSLIGEGGMGKVYLARQLDLDREVVVKVMHDHVAKDKLFCERFQRETLLMARFQHPYAVALYDASVTDPNGPCIVMEHIRGETLDRLLERHGRLSARRMARLLNQFCEVLHAAHSQGIIHRDLKPANLMVVDPDTEYEMIKVMDFGLAKLVNKPGQGMDLTGSTSDFTVGTPGYMCPEQARGEDMDHRGDLYSVGVILYEVLCGRLPFTGSSTMDVMLAHATEPPPPFAYFGAADLPPAIENVVVHCLEKDPAQRPASARELAAEFEAALTKESTAGAAPTELSPPVLNRRTRPIPIRPTVETADRFALVQRLEAWMPEAIAGYKLRGFVEDAGGEVMESVPGRIRVRLGGKGSVYELAGRGSLSWLGLGRKCLINLELHLERPEANQGHLFITATLTPHANQQPDETAWQAVAGQIFGDLRAYLMGQGQIVASA
jgi:eukaryotic-like serine/threonine-protein kinase